MLESVKIRLRAQGKLTSHLEYCISEFETICLAEIRSVPLREAVNDYLETEAPLEFFTAPASSSGKHHPVWQSLAGGILLNTTECCIGADRKIRMYPELTNDDASAKDEPHDVVYVATILSDTFKSEDAGKKWTEFSHHQKAAEAWRRISQKHNLTAPLGERIASAIQWHLGRFTPGSWPPDKRPQDLHLLDFIVHELDMDFANRRLSDVFERKLAKSAEGAGLNILEKEFDSSSGYFQHVEGKLTNLLVFFATLLLAVVTAAYYVGSSDMFRNMQFSHTPRSFLIGLLVLVFALISLVFIGVYTELRVRKIAMLEQIAAIREHAVNKADTEASGLKAVIRNPVGVKGCPPHLRRPSEDWYTLLLMTISSASAVAVGIPFWTFWVFHLNAVHWYPQHPNLIWLTEGVLAFGLTAYIEFAWYTRFCYDLDLERKAEVGASAYTLFRTHGGSFPFPLGLLDKLAGWIEQRHDSRAQKPIASDNSNTNGR